MTIFPSETQALVVGIESYGEGLPPLDGPASDACTFAHWLVRRGVPPDNIRLLLAPLERNAHLLHGGTPAPVLASAQRIRAEIEDDLPIRQGRLLVLYWSGHGVVHRSSNRRLLLYPGAAPRNLKNLDFESMVQYVRSDKIPRSALGSQIMIVDTCSTWLDEATLGASLPQHSFPAGQPVETREHIQLFSSSEGEASANEERAGGSPFSRHLMERLEATDGNVWPPPLAAIAKDLDERFRRLDESGRYDQRPQLLSFRPSRGGEGIETAFPRDPFAKAADRVTVSYDNVFKRVRVSEFTGRVTLQQELDGFLRQNPRGVVQIEGNAGLGKSALLAHLARQHGWIHHFVEVDPGPSGVAEGLRKIAVQVITRWRLQSEYTPETLPDLAAKPAFMNDLLALAARRAASSPIVIAVDGLDESAPGANENTLGLPTQLPENVYLVVSHRPAQVRLSVDAPRRVLRLTAEDSENLEDTRRYLQAVVARPGIAQVVAESGLTAEAFVAELSRKSAGVWIYLKYVIEEIESGRRRPLELDRLPEGLWRYYAEFWEEEAARGDWAGVRRPLLGLLAVAVEELAPDVLARLAGLSGSSAVQPLLQKDWRPFLSQSHGLKYRLYHASLRDFLEGRVDPAEFTTAQWALIEEMKEAARAAHSRIADEYLETWGGLPAALSGLRDEKLRRRDDGYGFRHVLSHLDRADRVTDIKELLTAQWSREERVERRRSGWRAWLDRLLRRRYWVVIEHHTNAWHWAKNADGDLGGYGTDLGLASQSARRCAESLIAEETSASPVILEVRCALMSTSLVSQAENMDPFFLGRLLAAGRINGAQALAYVRRMPEAEARLIGLLQASRFLPEPDRAAALADVSRGLRSPGRSWYTSTPHEPWLTRLRRALHDELPASFWDLLLDRMEADRDCATALAVLGPAMPDRLLPRIAQMAAALPRRSETALVVASLAGRFRAQGVTQIEKIQRDGPHLSEMPQDAHLLALAQPGRSRGEIERQAADLHVPPPERNGWDDRALRMSWLALAAVLPGLPADCTRKLSGEALALAGRVPPENTNGLIEALTALAAREDLDGFRALAGTDTHWSTLSRLNAVARRAVALGDSDYAVELVTALPQDNSATADVVATIGPLLERRARRSLIDWASRTPSNRWKVQALSGLAEFLSDAQLEGIRESAREIDDDYDARPALAHLAPRTVVDPASADYAMEWAEGFGWRRGYAVARLAPRLDAERRAALAKRVLKWPDIEDRAVALVGLAKSAPPNEAEPLLAAAFRAAQSIEYEGNRLTSMAQVVAASAEPRRAARAEALFEQLRSVARHRNDWLLDEVTTIILPALSPQSLRRLVRVVAEGRDPNVLDRMGARIAERMHPLIQHLVAELWDLAVRRRHTAPTRAMPEPREVRATSRAVMEVQGLLSEAAAEDARPLSIMKALLQALSIDDTHERADALACVAALIDDAEDRGCLESAAAELRGLRQEEDDVERALEGLRQHGDARRLRRLIKDAPVEAQERALAEVRAIAEASSYRRRKYILADLLPDEFAEKGHPWGHLRSRFIDGLGAAIHPVRRETFEFLLAQGFSEDPSDAKVVPLLPDDLLPIAWERALAARWDYKRHVLEALVARIERWPPAKVHPLWRAAIDQASERTRGELCQDVATLAPLIEAMAGREAIGPIIDAIEATRRWWP